MKDENPTADFISTFVDPKEVMDRYITVPQVLNKLVLDVNAHLDELGLTEKEPQMSIQDHLACMLQTTSAEFQAHLSTWIMNYAPDIHMIEKWLAVHGLTLQDYLQHLKGQGASDGLELWLTSMGMDTPFKLVLEDVVWSTSWAGIDFQYPIFMLVSYTDFILCEEQSDDDLSQLGAAAPQSAASTVQQVGGRPLTLILEYPPTRDSSHLDTDPDSLLDDTLVQRQPIWNAGVSIL